MVPERVQPPGARTTRQDHLKPRLSVEAAGKSLEALRKRTYAREAHGLKHDSGTYAIATFIDERRVRVDQLIPAFWQLRETAVHSRIQLLKGAVHCEVEMPCIPGFAWAHIEEDSAPGADILKHL
eukprot:CAMPEP_0119419956 /NCGR_PEP_ID=MMETSP1335-20130426/22212_1 /TAXON_ID=259385 /ORGANISM="Chrysoculter rhomboideus, Strain RCC1486" /LENGTH=124 /DNA_ID=CAMNT_0007445287 /DNA_START=12 /DNA_END=384 /DNA_ORIENTATION=-